MSSDPKEILSRKVDLVHDSDLADTLVELRQAWGGAIAELADACFDELAENYGGEEYEDALNAFAQELTVKGRQLYRMSEDDVDTFVYANADETVVFEKLLKKEKSDFKPVKQQGRKFGAPARRNELEGRIEGVKFPANNESIMFESFAGDHVYGFRYGKDNKVCGGFVIDLSQSDWVMREYEQYYRNVVYDPPSRTFAAWDNALNCVVMGKEPLYPDKWKVVSPVISGLPRLSWCDSTLFFGRGDNLYAIKNEKCNQILSGESTYGNPDFVQIADGRIFAANNRAFYCVTKKLLGGYAAKPHHFKFMQNGFLCYGLSVGDQILYCQALAEKGKEIVVLIRLDVDSGRYAYTRLKGIACSADITDFDNDFWYVNGKLDPLVKGKDMAQFIHKETGEVFHVKAGALGKYRLSNVIRLSNGKVIFDVSATGSSRLFKPADFWVYLKEKNPSPEKLAWTQSEAPYPNPPDLKAAQP